MLLAAYCLVGAFTFAHLALGDEDVEKEHPAILALFAVFSACWPVYWLLVLLIKAWARKQA